MEQQIILAKISRSSSAGVRKGFDVFCVPRSPFMTVQTLLRYIHENLDPTLAFRDYRCGSGLCNTCLARINGMTKRTCETLVPQGEEIQIEPASGRIIRDLVTDFD